MTVPILGQPDSRGRVRSFVSVVVVGACIACVSASHLALFFLVASVRSIFGFDHQHRRVVFDQTSLGWTVDGRPFHLGTASVLLLLFRHASLLVDCRGRRRSMGAGWFSFDAPLAFGSVACVGRMCRSHVSVVFFHPHSHVFEPRVERKLQRVLSRVDKRVVSIRHTHVDRGKPHGQSRVNVHDPNLSQSRRDGTRRTDGWMKRERMPRGEARTTTSQHHRRWRSKTCQTEMRMRWASDADASDIKHVNTKDFGDRVYGQSEESYTTLCPPCTPMGTIQITCIPS